MLFCWKCWLWACLYGSGLCTPSLASACSVIECITHDPRKSLFSSVVYWIRMGLCGGAEIKYGEPVHQNSSNPCRQPFQTVYIELYSKYLCVCFSIFLQVPLNKSVVNSGISKWYTCILLDKLRLVTGECKLLRSLYSFT